MKKISVIILAIVIVACTASNKNVPDGVEIVPVDVHKVSKDASSFLEKIEIVPLETNDSSIFHKCNKIIYNKSMDMYALYTSDQFVFTFSGNGKYIDNSKRIYVQGTKEYNMVLDIYFNPYLKLIDILNPYGTVYTYSPTFELLAKRKFKPEFPLEYLMALDAENYI